MEEKTPQKYQIAIDPGLKNMGVWAGVLDENGMPHTIHLGKYDVVVEGTKPLYEGAVDLVLGTPWMSDPSLVAEAVVETQAVKNIPARIAATAIYGALRGKGIQTYFSGAAMKNKAMDTLSEKMGFELINKPDKLDKDADDKERAKRRRMMHSINKKNSALLVRKVLETIKDVETSRIFNETDKVDDLADAMLLGIGACLARAKAKAKTKVKKTKQSGKSKNARKNGVQKSVLEYIQNQTTSTQQKEKDEDDE